MGHIVQKWGRAERRGPGRLRGGCRKDRLVGAAVLGETHVSKDEATCLGSYDPGCLGWLLEFQIGS